MTARECVIDGTRAIAFATSEGLEFAVLVGRSLDIGPLAWRCTAVGYVGRSGFRHPAGHDPYADDHRGFNRLFSGFLVTGGLDHIRQPANGRPLHGTLPFTPANLTAVGNGDRQQGSYCEGVVDIPGYRLKRRIEVAPDGAGFRIVDIVKNTASVPQRQASLYHFNIGRPTLASGTVVKQGAYLRLGPLELPGKALDSVSYPVDDGGAQCVLTTPEIAVKFVWEGATLPYLQLWGDLDPERSVLSIEPCTSERLEGGLSGEEPILESGHVRRYALSVSFSSD